MNSLFTYLKRHPGFLLVAIVAFLWPLLPGCNKKSNKAQVTGKVIYKGSPMPGGTLFLYPQDSNTKLPPGAAQTGSPVSINADGTFSASGVPTGKMKVTVQSIPASNTPAEPPANVPEEVRKNIPKMPMSGPASGMKSVEIPAEYASPDQTPWTWEITPGKNPPKDFEIK